MIKKIILILAIIVTVMLPSRGIAAGDPASHVFPNTSNLASVAINSSWDYDWVGGQPTIFFGTPNGISCFIRPGGVVECNGHYRPYLSLEEQRLHPQCTSYTFVSGMEGTSNTGSGIVIEAEQGCYGMPNGANVLDIQHKINYNHAECAFFRDFTLACRNRSHGFVIRRAPEESWFF